MVEARSDALSADMESMSDLDAIARTVGSDYLRHLFSDLIDINWLSESEHPVPPGES